MSDLLFPYQAVGRDFLAARRRALLVFSAGLGKTRTALLALSRASGCIWVGPLSTLKGIADEVRLVRPDLEILPRPKRGQVGAGVIPGPGQIWVCHPQALPAMWTADPRALGPLTVVLDETHMYRNLRSAIIATLGSYTRLASQVWALDGTPAFDSADDLWVLWCLMGWAVHVRGKSHFDALVRGQTLRAFMETQGWAMRKTLDDVRADVKLPPMRRELVRLGAPPPMTWRPGLSLGEVRAALSVPKADAVCAWLAARGADTLGPCVLFFVHQDGAKRAADVLGRRAGVIIGGVSETARGRAVAAFRAGDLDHMIVSIAAGGAGLNGLQRSHTVLRAETDWSPKAQDQAAARVWRLGQGSACTEYVFAFDHWADAHVAELEGRKAAEITHAGF